MGMMMGREGRREMKHPSTHSHICSLTHQCVGLVASETPSPRPWRAVASEPDTLLEIIPSTDEDDLQKQYAQYISTYNEAVRTVQQYVQYMEHQWRRERGS